MRILPSDETRMIDLPGVGPCPRPVDIDQKVTGFRRLKSLRIYRFQPGPPVHGDSEGDEVFITAMAGRFDMTITGAHPVQAVLTAGAEPQALYMTPEHSYLLTPLTPALVAYARAEAGGRVASQAVAGFQSQGLAEHLRWQVADLRDGVAMAVGWTAGGPGRESLVHVAEGAVISGAGLLRQGETLALEEGEPAILTARGDARLLILAA